MNTLHRQSTGRKRQYTSPQDVTKNISCQKVRNKQRIDQKLELNWKDGVILILVLLFTLFYNLNAQAQGMAVDFDDISSGMMMQFDQESGEYHSLSLANAEYDVEVYGLLATIKLKQTFVNSLGSWVTEGVYAFPMADKSAVYQLKMVVGERVIEGEIHEKKQAEAIYEQAKSEGLTATIVKQHRPNIFTAEVANIAPHEVITVEITYQLALQYNRDYYQLRLPMAIKPRYIPTESSQPLPGESNVNDLGQRKINVLLNAGFELDDIRSLHHNIDVVNKRHTQTIQLIDRQLYDGNDFVLRWYPHLEDTPKAAYFSEIKAGFEYVMLLVLPPNNTTKTNKPRNMTFIMDTSGSMQGRALNQSKDALLYALSELNDDTFFNIIDFDSTAKALFPSSTRATPENISLGLDFVDSFRSDGGTHMAPALTMAMQNQNIKSDFLNQIIFMTDGSVGNEAALFDQIARDIGDARLFTVAIGPAPNNYFMSKAALFGRGTYTHIGSLDEVDESMGRLFARLARPALTDVSVFWDSLDVEQSPSVIPDLYMDQPLVITGKIPLNKVDAKPLIGVSGLVADKNWSEQLNVINDGQTSGIARLWARNKVEEMTDDLMLGGDYDILKQDIINLALTHHLITEFTAMVAVDRNPDASRMAAAQAAQQVAYPQGSLGWRWNLLVGLMMMSLSVIALRRV